jgi:F-type H+-transporting ATPase subunit b
MGDMHLAVLAAGEEGGTNNFLIPNGTFFFVLITFLIVLGVIGAFVVPSITKVLGEREDMVTKTTQDNRQAGELEAAAETDYDNHMAAARTEASAIRDEARTAGRKVVDDKRGHANDESAAALQQAEEQLKRQSDAIEADLRSSVETLSATLASRVLGVEISATSATSPGR